jgi:hypothetical protein
MQTLGLSGEGKRSDGWLKSNFWPTVENARNDVPFLDRNYGDSTSAISYLWLVLDFVEAK